MSDTRNIKIGACRVFFGGVDLGFTQGGVEVSVTTETHKIMVDQFGKTIVDEIILSRNIDAKVPLAETTIENLVNIMPGAVLSQTGATYASGNITYTTVPVTGTGTVTVNGIVFTAMTLPTAPNQFAIGANIAATAANLAATLEAYDDPAINVASYVATAGVVAVTYDQAGGPDSAYVVAAGNAFTLAVSGTGVTVSGATLSGGVGATSRTVTVPTAVNTSLLALAQELVLHPQILPSSDHSQDLVIPLANTAGAMQFAYQVEKERIFNVSFNGYPNATTGELFSYGGQ